jgi:hypothetical protein
MTAPAKPDLESIIDNAFELLETRRRGATGDYWDALRAAVTAAPEPHRQSATPLPVVENLAAHLYVALSQRPEAGLEKLLRASGATDQNPQPRTSDTAICIPPADAVMIATVPPNRCGAHRANDARRHGGRRMVQYTLAEAAKATDKSKSTILRSTIHILPYSILIPNISSIAIRHTFFTS